MALAGGGQVQILSYGVFALGVVLCLVCLALLFLGKRVPGQGEGQQVIKVGGAEFSLNSAVALFVVSVFVAVFPLGMALYSGKTGESGPDKPPVRDNASVQVPVRDVINVNGYVHDRNGHYLSGVTVSAFSGQTFLSQQSTTLSDGAFSLEIPLTHGRQMVRLVARKGSYEQDIGVLRGPADVTFTKVLFGEE